MTLESPSIGVGQFGGDGNERLLLNNNNNGGDDGYVIWKVVYMSGVLIYMFVALLSDRLGADMVMVSSLALCMASEIISIKEGLAGFANEGVLTVVVLFVVAAGISLTGALDWYMGKLLGSPSSMASAQLRLMIPITMVSAFLNNTPVVAVMIPIVQKWATTISQHQQQLLIPLSFASIFGGTCTLIGTSTNLVVLGLLQTRYPNNAVNIGLFDLAIYGVPLAMVGMTYLLLMTPHLLANTSNTEDDGTPVLMGAKLTQWSAAAGRSVQRSGLRDTGGIYLVSVYRATTGNVHRAVGQDFVLHQGDILYFTTAGKNLHDFGPFCDTHGLEVVTHDDDVTTTNNNNNNNTTTIEDGKEPMFLPEQSPINHHHNNMKQLSIDTTTLNTPTNIAASLKSIMPTSLSTIAETTIPENEQSDFYYEKEEEIRHWSETKRLLLINRITDQIRNGGNNNDHDADAIITWGDGPPQIVVNNVSSLVVIAVNSKDRPGLLLDVSRGLLLKLNLNFHHTEASVVAGRSLSIWRCELLHSSSNKRNKKDESYKQQQQQINLDEIYSALHDLLQVDNENGGVVETVIKRRGLQVIRAEVGKQSRLVGKTLSEIPNFRSTYKAAIVSPSVGKFQIGMVVVLQAAQDSPLLQRPPANFYDVKRTNSSNSLSKMVRRLTNSTDNLLSLDITTTGTVKKSEPKTTIINDLEQQLDPAVVQKDSTDSSSFFIGDMANEEEDMNSQQQQHALPVVAVEENEGENISQDTMDVWKDFKVLFSDEDSGGVGSEFLTAMVITSNSNLASKSAIQSGLDKLPGVVLVSIDRTVIQEEENQSNSEVFSTTTAENHKKVQAIAPSEVLKEGDVVWYAGSASAIGDLRKIPGWKSYLNEEVKKVSDKVHDRRLVQAVIARKGPLVGKTVRDVRFRTKYGAAVISINREGTRIQDFPGNIPLQGGDVLLLEAGPTFLHNQAQHHHSSAFALLAEVRDSAPPRLRLLLPALGLTITMLAVYTANLSSLLVSGLIAAGLMILLGIISQQEARNAVNWEVYVTIASAFGIGSALTNSGVAKAVADALVKIGTGINMGDAGLYGAVYFATFLISNVVTNNAAAALLFPIAMDAAEKTNADLTKMSFSLMLGASASFMSPFGYTTNLLIYGPGGYKYVDFLKIGTPLQIVLWIVSIFLLSVNIPWYINWIAMTCLLILTSLILISKSRKKKIS